MKVYDASKLIVVFGAFSISEFSDNDFLTISRDGDSFRDISGVEGEVARFKTRDQRGTIKINLMQTSSAHLKLSAIAQSDEILGKGVLPIFIKDGNGKNLYFSPESWLLSFPEITFGKELRFWQWRVRCKILISFTGGTT